MNSAAYVGGADFRHEWGNRAYSFSAQIASSLVLGSEAAMTATQRSSARYFQRPDAGHLDVDSTADLPVKVSSVLFRSAQEVLRNVASHSGARRVGVQAVADGDTAVLVVDDDGRGFDQRDLEQRMSRGHLGLRALGDLVAQAEGRLVAEAAQFGPRQLRILGRRILDVVAPEVAEDAERRALEREEAHAAAVTTLTSRRRGDGTTDLATLPCTAR